MKTTAAETPQQNSVCESRGGIWNGVAKAVIDQHPVSFLDDSRTKWTLAICNWALNARVGSTGYSPSRCVLRRGMRLPYDLLSHGNRPTMHLRARDDASFRDQNDLLSTARRATAVSRYHRGLSRAFLARTRLRETLPAEHQFAIGDQIFYFRGSSKRNCVGRWHGPAIVVGDEGAKMWVCQRNRTLRVSFRPFATSTTMNNDLAGRKAGTTTMSTTTTDETFTGCFPTTGDRHATTSRLTRVL